MLAVIVPLGLLTKLYGGPGSGWVNANAGGFFYVVFFVLVAHAASRRAAPGAISLAVLAGTIGVEFLQLWHPPLLTEARRTFFGRTLLGNTFSWYDFPYYGAGALSGYIAARALMRRESTP